MSALNFQVPLWLPKMISGNERTEAIPTSHWLHCTRPNSNNFYGLGREGEMLLIAKINVITLPCRQQSCHPVLGGEIKLKGNQIHGFSSHILTPSSSEHKCFQTRRQSSTIIIAAYAPKLVSLSVCRGRISVPVRVDLKLRLRGGGYHCPAGHTVTTLLAGALRYDWLSLILRWLRTHESQSMHGWQISVVV